MKLRRNNQMARAGLAVLLVLSWATAVTAQQLHSVLGENRFLQGVFDNGNSAETPTEAPSLTRAPSTDAPTREGLREEPKREYKPKKQRPPTVSPRPTPTPTSPAPTVAPTIFPTGVPTAGPITLPTAEPSAQTISLTRAPYTRGPTTLPTRAPTGKPTELLTESPTNSPTTTKPTLLPTVPTSAPSSLTFGRLTRAPAVWNPGRLTRAPTPTAWNPGRLTRAPSLPPVETAGPTAQIQAQEDTQTPTSRPTALPTSGPTSRPTTPRPSPGPTPRPTPRPSVHVRGYDGDDATSPPTISPKPTVSPSTARPTGTPTDSPSLEPTKYPTTSPTASPSTQSPTAEPTTQAPTTQSPTKDPTGSPTERVEDRESSPSSQPTVAPSGMPSGLPTSIPTSSMVPSVSQPKPPTPADSKPPTPTDPSPAPSPVLTSLPTPSATLTTFPTATGFPTWTAFPSISPYPTYGTTLTSMPTTSEMNWQLEQSLTKTFNEEVFGAAVSLSGDGTVVTVGAFMSNERAEGGGRIVRFDSNTNTETVIYGRELAYWGYQVSTSRTGDRLVTLDSNTGYFELVEYKEDFLSFQPLASVNPEVFPGSADFALSGDGKWLAIVGESYDPETELTSVLLFMYEYNEQSQRFVQYRQSELFGQNESEDWGFFDIDMDYDGKFVVVSQIGQGDFAGKVRVYERVVTGMTLKGEAFASDTINDGFGQDVEVLVTPSQQLIVGFSVPYEDTVYVYTFEDGKWNMLGSPITATDVLADGAGSEFGFDISFSDAGDKILVGAPAYMNAAGAVQGYIFVDGGWLATGNPMGWYEGSSFGEVVECSSDCSVIAVGAPLNCNDDSSCGGAVYVFRDASRPES